MIMYCMYYMVALIVFFGQSWEVSVRYKNLDLHVLFLCNDIRVLWYSFVTAEWQMKRRVFLWWTNLFLANCFSLTVPLLVTHCQFLCRAKTEKVPSQNRLSTNWLSCLCTVSEWSKVDFLIQICFLQLPCWRVPFQSAGPSQPCLFSAATRFIPYFQFQHKPSHFTRPFIHDSRHQGIENDSKSAFPRGNL